MPRSYGETSRFYDGFYEAAGKDYEEESAELHRIVQSRHPAARAWLDVACGTGSHLAHLRSHYEVAGVDLSAEMLAEAADRLPGVPLTHVDMRSIQLGRRFDVVSCLFSAVAYMPSTTDLGAAITSMALHLEPGGLLIVDGWIRPSDWHDPGTVSAMATNGEAAAARLIRSRREGAISTLELHFLIGDPADGVEYVTEEHRLTLFTGDEYRWAFTQAGLQVEVIDSPHPERDRYVGAKM